MEPVVVLVGAMAGIFIAALALAFWASFAMFFLIRFPTEMQCFGLCGMCAVIGVVAFLSYSVWEEVHGRS